MKFEPIILTKHKVVLVELTIIQNQDYIQLKDNSLIAIKEPEGETHVTITRTGH